MHVRDDTPQSWANTSSFLPGVDGPVIRPAAILACDAQTRHSTQPSVTICQRMEETLKRHRVQYVVVDENRRKLFCSAKMGEFHFVCFQRPGPHWLIWAGAVREGAREGMAEWQQAFGEGFVAVLAHVASEESVGFHALDGRDIELRECRRADAAGTLNSE
jgi:hypothetical protein